MTGKHEEAIAMLRALEERYPGEAAVAAGLGAAFELSGNDAKALEWIREFAARDPKAEDSSEWLHIRILEAKIGLARDPEWLRHNPVLGVTFGAEPHPEPPEEGFADETGRVLYATDVRLAIMHQLNLRLQMFPTPDAMLGDLYMSAADLQIAFNVPFHQPLLQYRCAIELGVPNATLAKLRHDTFAAGNPPAAENAKRMFKRCRYKTLAPYGTHTRFPTGVIATLIVMCGVIFVSWARARRRQR